MGSCLASHSAGTEMVDFPPTAKVITIDGSLIEFLVPANASQILGNDCANSFICCSDELDFDKSIPALGSLDCVELGQIYFILPRSMLHRPLMGEDMAALAVKASQALTGELGNKRVCHDVKEKRVFLVQDLSESFAKTN